jgi:hypothetical protein
MQDDPFAVLGVPAGATAADVSEAYRALAQIYHPDRYADAPERVQAEATRRMQAVNAAYAQVRARPGQPAPAAPRQDAPPPPPAPSRPSFVHYVDGAKGFHNGDVAPLGFASVGSQMARVAGAARCARLDDELRAWFEQQRSNASRVSQQLYASWDDDERELYAATLGCSQVTPAKARALGVPCGLCRPATS